MKESQIQTQIETYLKYLMNQGKCVYIKNNSGATITREGRFIKFGKKGTADFIVFLPEGRTLHLEVKNEKGRQNNNQVEMQKKLEGLGHEYKICRSLEEIQDRLNWETTRYYVSPNS